MPACTYVLDKTFYNLEQFGQCVQLIQTVLQTFANNITNKRPWGLQTFLQLSNSCIAGQFNTVHDMWHWLWKMHVVKHPSSQVGCKY